MTHQDRDRLLLSLAFALVIHTVIFLLVGVVDWPSADYPEMNTVYVDLLDYESAPAVEPEREVTPPPRETEPVAEPEPVEPEPVRQEPEPVPPRDTSVTQQPQPVVRRQTQAPQTAQSPAPDATGPEFVDEPLIGVPQDNPDTASDRLAARTPDAELFSFNEATPEGTLPAWVEQGVIQPLDTLAAGDQQDLEEKEQSVPGFSDLLNRVVAALDSPGNTRAPETSGTAASGDGTETTTTGNTQVQWVGGGSRRPIGTLAMPDLTSDDFGGLVPAQLTFVVVFDVDAGGHVVPGSLILRSGSGYTSADQKVRDAVRRWTFEPAPGSSRVSAIATLPLERDDVR